MTVLRLDQLSLINFRSFARCDIGLHPDLTVLVAENGSGKTAVLDAATSALSVIVNALYSGEAIRKLIRNDVRLVPDKMQKMVPSLPTELAAKIVVDDKEIELKSTIRTYGDKVRPSSQYFRRAQEVSRAFSSTAGTLPLVAYYGTGRLWSEHRLTEGRRSSVTNVEERVVGYSGCLSAASSFKGMSTWYAHRMTQTASPLYKESLAANLAMLQGVNQAAETVLKPTGWSKLQWSETQGLTAQHEKHGRLPLFMLSDGVRTMLALVADVARRCVSLNPKLSDEASIKTSGILIIDEVDMHLHPQWQQQILGLLREAFPLLQIIVSTHSPHVLSTVDRSSIRVLHVENGDVLVETPQMQTKGVKSADVLASVMDVDPIPQMVEAKELSVYRALIEDGKANEAEAARLREKLIGHFGQEHPLMLECDRLIRFQKFRLGKAKPEGLS